MTTASTAKERPILFNAPMVRAVLDGHKIQTRRVVTPRQPIPAGMERFEVRKDPVFDNWVLGPAGASTVTFMQMGNGWVNSAFGPCRFGYPGDRLWVREAHAFVACGSLAPGAFFGPTRGINGEYDDSYYKIEYAADPGDIYWEPPHFRPSIHMPRWASRILLEVVSVRVERLQAITEEDAQAEGATQRPNCQGFNRELPGWSMDWSPVGQPGGVFTPLKTESDIALGTARFAFANYWNKLSGPDAWDSNPWVWVVTFRRLDDAGARS